MSKAGKSAVTSCILTIAIMAIAAVSAWGQFPGSLQIPIAPTSVPQFVDPLPHFAYPGARVDATAPGTPLSVEMVTTNQQALSTGTLLPSGVVVGPTTGLTHVWAYKISNGTVTRGPLWPGFTVEAKRGVPLNVLYQNKIYESYDAMNLALDQTLHWAIGTSSMAPYLGPVPAVAHLHGGEVPPWSDGGPDAWYTPDGATGGAAALTNVYHYPNTQEAATLWFHDHALGATRLNVYAGLAAFYFLRDDAEDLLQLPGWSGDGLVQEVDKMTGLPHGDPYLPEIEVVIQDRMFDQNGQLYFPAGALGGAPNPGVHPYWVPEFEGDIITVNGKTWPYLSVAPRKYRMRFLNGSNARFYELFLTDLVSGAAGPTIWQVGSDGGLLDAPVAIAGNLVMAPGERFDLVIDFGAVASPSGAWTLRNIGRTPYPKGGTPNGMTVGRIMEFVVNGQMVGADNSVITGRAVPTEKLVNYATATPAVPVNKRRQLTLNEVMGPGGPLEAIVNNTKWGGHSPRPYNDFTIDPSGQSNTMYSELMTEGETEMWEIINLTGDAHPIHLHLVQFQLVRRQRFQVGKYMNAYNAAFAAAGVAPGMIDAWGPPLDYNTGNDPMGVNWTPYLGGNPDVTPFLKGPKQPANPNEQGWKDTYIMMPGEVTTVIARFAPTDATARGQNYFDFDPSTSTGYVWHCHIIDHEDNEMMRPYAVIANGPAGRMGGPMYAGYHTVHPDAAALAKRSTGTVTPDEFVLNQNYPNPFNPETKINFHLGDRGQTSLKVYNSIGQVVRTLLDQQIEAGNHTVVWDGRGDNGIKLGSGVYFYRLQTETGAETRKMVMLK